MMEADVCIKRLGLQSRSWRGWIPSSMQDPTNFNVDAVKTEADAGLGVSAKAYARGVRALEELQFRRKGLAASLVIILVLIGGLVFKIRQLERRNEPRNPG